MREQHVQRPCGSRGGAPIRVQGTRGLDSEPGEQEAVRPRDSRFLGAPGN